MALRPSIPISELRDGRPDSDHQEHGTEYSASRGGWVRDERPAPAPTGDGRLRGDR